MGMGLQCIWYKFSNLLTDPIKESSQTTMNSLEPGWAN